MWKLRPIIMVAQVMFITLLHTSQAVMDEFQSGGRIPQLKDTVKAQSRSIELGLNLKNVEKYDFHDLIDLKNEFYFVINHEACPKSVEILWLVISAPGHVEHRKTIRETWGSGLDKRRVLMYFLLGTVNKTEDQLKIVAENEATGDLIQCNHHDSYRNLTYKHVCGLKWFSYYCPLAKFMIKNDDDMFVNSPFLLSYLLENRNQIQEEKQLIWCNKFALSKPYRNESKYQVSVEEYSKEYYPPFCQGGSVIYSADMVKDLYVEAQKSKYFRLDDVLVTGILAQKLNVPIKLLGKMLITADEAMKLGKADGNRSIEYFFIEPHIQWDNITSLWNSVSKS